MFRRTALGLLLLVQVPGIGKGVNGAKRWIGMGSFSMQPSEVMKLMMVLGSIVVEP